MLSSIQKKLEEKKLNVRKISRNHIVSRVKIISKYNNHSDTFHSYTFLLWHFVNTKNHGASEKAVIS